MGTDVCSSQDGRFVRVVPDSMRTVEQYGGVSIEIGEGLSTSTTLDHLWIMSVC